MKKHRFNERSSHPAKSLGLGLSAIALLALCSQSAQAVNYVWDENGATAGFGTAGNTGTSWSSSTSLFAADNTAGTTAPSGTQATTTGDTAIFGKDGTNPGLGAGVITVSGTVDIGSIRFGSSTGQGAVTLSGGTINLPATATFIGNNVGAGTINSAVTGTGATTLQFTSVGGSGGTINLGGGYTGGSLRFTGASTASLTAGTYTVSNVTTSGNSNSRNLNLNGGTLTTAGDVFASGVAGQLSFNGGTLKSNNAAGITVFDNDNNIPTNAGGATFDTTVGNITINSTVALSGSGKRTFIGATGNTFTANALSVANGTPLGFGLGSVAINNATPLVTLTTFTETLDGGTYNVDFGGFNFDTAGTYNLIGVSGSISGTFLADDFQATNATFGGGLSGAFALGGNSLSYVVSAVPEPSAFACFAGLAALGVGMTRRRRQS